MRAREFIREMFGDKVNTLTEKRRRKTKTKRKTKSRRVYGPVPYMGGYFFGGGGEGGEGGGGEG